MAPAYSGEAAWRRVRQVVSGLVPAAGAAPTITVPAGHLWRLVAISASLVTSAAVANRAARFRVSDGNVTFLDIPPVAVQAASLTGRYTWADGVVNANVSGGQSIGLPELWLEPGSSITITTDLIDVADQWSALTLYVVDTTVRDGSIDISELADTVALAPTGQG